MKAIFLIFIIAATVYGGAHPYFAESNYICELCRNANQLQGVAHPKLYEVMEKFGVENVQDCESFICNDNMKFLMEDEKVFLSQEFVNEINSKQSSWVAESTRFDGMKLKDIKSMMGTIVDADWVIKADNVVEATGMEVPESFDSAENWPDCADNINKVRDQANCGSCWAFGTTDAFNNRRCVAGKSDASELLSEADTTGCCGFLSCFSMGCNGGQVGTPWTWFKNTGVVTGGDFGASGFCYDYTMPQCAHHIDPTPERPDCSEIKQVNPACGTTCPDDSSITYSSDKKNAASSYGLGSIDAIKESLVTKGPVTAAFTVYEDFLTYKSGVYQHTSGSALGGHAVIIVGYGTENGLDYWRVRNSWNDGWGDNGHFKIEMSECGISGQCHAGDV